MTLIRTSLLNGIAVIARLASGLVINKILAIYVGPAGYAVIGQFQNVISLVVSLAGGILATGVTKETAQHFDDEARQSAVWKTAIRFSLIASLAAGISLLCIGGWLAEWLLHSTDMHNIFIWLALGLPAMAASNLLLAIVNGKKAIGIYVAANIISSILSVLITTLFTLSQGLYGTLIAYTISPAASLLATGILVNRQDWFKARLLWGGIDKFAMRGLADFGLMALVSAITVPLTYMLIRDHLASSLGLNSAGYWQASWKISEMYLMLVTTTLSVYYLPRLAEIRTSWELKAEIFKVSRLIVPMTALGAGVVFLLRDFIILTLFTPDFLPMRELFLWQLMGDVMKIASWICGFIITARGLVKYYMLSEIFSHLVLVLFTWGFVAYFGLQGAPMAYLATYSLHFMLMAVLARREILRMKVSERV